MSFATSYQVLIYETFPVMGDPLGSALTRIQTDQDGAVKFSQGPHGVTMIDRKGGTILIPYSRIWEFKKVIVDEDA